MNIRDILANHRNEILWWEICSILHDIGKLSDKFIYYRQKWHTMDQGWENRDPHDHEWLDKHETLLALFPALKDFFDREFSSALTGKLSVRSAVHGHAGDPGNDELLLFLKLGDGIDSQYDRNNPLIGAEQTNHADNDRATPVFGSNVFGYEGERTRIVPGLLDRARSDLYTGLERLTANYCGKKGSQDLSQEDYNAIRNTIRRHFRPALSDTTRPGNDTDLWEHTYSVASIAKSLHIGRLLGNPPNRTNAFRIWGFGFDSLRYLSFSHKIGDLIGRREVLNDVFDEAEQLLEYSLPFGNLIYRDDNIVLFMVPALPEPQFAEANKMLCESVVEISLRLSHSEVIPAFVFGPPVSDLTCIVRQIAELRERTAVPVSEGAAKLAERIRSEWTPSPGGGRSICSVCRLRPTRVEKENTLVCAECLDRRKNRTESFSFCDAPASTPMIAEIADCHGRAVMIVAKLGLSRWLDGSLVRTSLITQPDAIAKTAVACEHITEQPLGKEGVVAAQAIRARNGYNYAKMLEDLQNCRKGHANGLLFLYGRGIVGSPPHFNGAPPHLQDDAVKAETGWKEILAAFHYQNASAVPPDDTPLLLNLLCGKTPTPSSVLDVWSTTESFFRSIAQPSEVFSQNPTRGIFRQLPPILGQKHLGLGAKDRAWFQLESFGGAPVSNRETLSARIDGSAYEVVCEKDAKRFWFVNSDFVPHPFLQPSAEVLLQREDETEPRRPARLITSGVKKQAYFPWRCISASPDLLLLLAPADKAVEITQSIYSCYLEEFGKAYGRLPLGIGHIFFAQHQPIFSVLDAARRMEQNFQELQRKDPEPLPLPVPAEDLALKLGDQTEDWHHPYIFTPLERSETPSYFKTFSGPMVRIPDLGADRQVLMQPNRYDAEFLGASSHRFRLHLATRTLAHPADGPILLEELLGTSVLPGMQTLWNALLSSPGVTDSSIRNFEAAIATREASWKTGGHAEARKAAKALASSLIPNYFPPEVRPQVFQALESGLLMRTLNLYVRILKRRLGQGNRTAPPAQKEAEEKLAGQPTT
jgi:hypothetical protein